MPKAKHQRCIEGAMRTLKRGQRLDREDLTLAVCDDQNEPKDVYDVTFTLFAIRNGKVDSIGTLSPEHPETGEYFAKLVVPLDALGDHKILWSFRETPSGEFQHSWEAFTVES